MIYCDMLFIIQDYFELDVSVFSQGFLYIRMTHVSSMPPNMPLAPQM